MFRRKRNLDDFSAEIEAHIDLETERLREQGMSEDEARLGARRAFGNVTRVRERFMEIHPWLWFQELWRDICFGIRILVRSPLITIFALLTLAVGIGATTCIFSAVYLVLLRPIPFKDPDRLVVAMKQDQSHGFYRNNISPPEILAWRNDSGAFEDFAAYTSRSCVLTGKYEAEEDSCEVVTSNLFSLLGAVPHRGRLFTVDEDQENGRKSAILSYRLWRRRFNEDSRAIGEAITVNGKSYTVVGVMAPSFPHFYASPYGKDPELWLSGIALSPAHPWNDYFGVGRLKAGMSLEQAAGRMDQVSSRLETSIPSLKGWRAQIESVRSQLSGESRLPLLTLMVAVAFVLLLACANVASLLLARSTARSREFAVRSALGARRTQIVRQLLIESLLIALVGGALGVLFANWGCKGLSAIAPAYILRSAPGLAAGAIDLRVLAFALSLAIATAVFFGLAPALQSTRVEVFEELRNSNGNSHRGNQSHRIREGLIVSEMAISMVLLVASGLMIRTLLILKNVDVGFRAQRVLSLRVPLNGDRYKDSQARLEFWQAAVNLISALPGVESVTVSRGLPIGDWALQSFATSRDPHPSAAQLPSADYVIAGPEYFKLLGIPIKSGRDFSATDNQSSEKIVIVNEEVAKLYWPGQNPIGEKLQLGPTSSPWLTIVGVSGNVHNKGPDEPPTPAIYVPFQQYPWLLGGPQVLFVRTMSHVSPASISQVVVGQIHRLDKDQPVTDVIPLEEASGEATAQQRMLMVIFSFFAALALFLAAIGIYSVLSYSVAQRTREIGVRVALGAERWSVLWLVVGHTVRLALFGIVIGSTVAAALTRLLVHFLFGVGPADIATFSAVALLLASTAILASLLPALRATRVNPVEALRYE